jgi:signal transduction histidine kinase
VKTRTLSGAIAFLLGVATVVLLGAAAVLMDHLVDAEMQRRFDADLLAQARALAALVESGPHGLDMDEAAGLPSRMLSGDTQGTYAVHCASGASLSSRPAPLGYPDGWTRTASDDPAFGDIDTGDRALRAVWFRFAVPGGDSGHDAPAQDCRLVFMQSRKPLDGILLAIDIILLVIPLLALLLVLALSPFLVRRGLRPLAQLCESMRGIGPNQPGRRLQPTGTRELEPLVAGFNEVLARMDEVLARERRFTDALAHETRTRLAELHTLVDVERHYPSGRPLHALLDEIGAISGELEGTVSGLLLLTRLDAGLESPDWRHVELESLVARHAARVAAVAQRRHLRVDAVPPARPATLVADVSLLDIVLGNLLGNACEYAPSGTGVRIAWNDGALTVSNPAPDLGEGEVACLGQRFWSKQQGRGGHTGLGLALAGAAATAMGFRLGFALADDGRLDATLDWRSARKACEGDGPAPGDSAATDGA